MIDRRDLATGMNDRSTVYAPSSKTDNKSSHGDMYIYNFSDPLF
jgi:hypothetical protein